jgi:hypothetical protein
MDNFKTLNQKGQTQRWFIGQQQFGPGHESASDGKHLLLTADTAALRRHAGSEAFFIRSISAVISALGRR